MKRPLGGRLANNSDTARYLGISPVTLWKWKQDPAMAFPAGYTIKNREINDLNAVDDWLLERATKKVWADPHE
jgi:hypothetical protein